MDDGDAVSDMKRVIEEWRGDNDEEEPMIALLDILLPRVMLPADESKRAEAWLVDVDIIALLAIGRSWKARVMAKVVVSVTRLTHTFLDDLGDIWMASC